MKKLADALRARAAAGEDFEKLQDEAIAASEIKGKPPTKLGKVRRTSLPPDQAAIFNLKPGETSQLITTPNGYLIYKVGEKDTLPLDKVRDEIFSTLRSQRMQDALQKHSAVGDAAVEREILCGSDRRLRRKRACRTTGRETGVKAPESGPK